MDTPPPSAAGQPKANPAGAAQQKSGGQPANWVPGAHELIPILPRGKPLFEGIPAPAIVIEALGPVIGSGALISRRAASVGVILVKDRGLFEVCAYHDGARIDGEPALQLIAGWTDATVSAYQFDPVVVAVAPALFRGSPCYDDLRLEWTDWKGLMGDLSARQGLFVVELDTPQGRGVMLILDGRQVATYTDSHPELGEASLLDALVASKRGSLWVHREPPTGPAPVTPGATPKKPAAAAPPKDAGAGSPAGGGPKAAPISVGIDWSTTPLWRAEAAAAAPPAPATNEPFDPFAILGAAIGGVAEDDDPPPPPRAVTGGTSVAAIATELKQIAQLRLDHSSTRVEAMVDEAAAQNRPLAALLEEIRGLAIRGVMQSTIDKMADDMAAIAPRAAG
jgi:hypothetical protein